MTVKKPAIFGVTGYKNSGKTTLVSKLVAALTARGHLVSTVKHAHHAFDIDQPGRDTYQHREAGAREVAIVSGKRWALMHELADEDEPSLDDILLRLGPCDLVIIEGYKKEPHPKIEVRNMELEHSRLWPDDETIVALACDADLDVTIPVFRRDAIEEIAAFVEQQVDLRPG